MKASSGTQWYNGNKSLVTPQLNNNKSRVGPVSQTQQQQQMNAPPEETISSSKRMSKSSSSRSKRKKGPGNRGGGTGQTHNFLEPLVELRSLSTQVEISSNSETVKNLKAQLAKSHKKSQKLNLIRNSQNTNNYFPSFYEPTQAQILEAENRKNEALLQIYTDSGTFSKVVAMTVAASVLDTKLPYPKLSNEVVEPLQDNRKKEELNKFCHDISTILGIPEMKSLDGNDYRRLWHLFSIFTNAMDQRICNDPTNKIIEDPSKSFNVPSSNGLRNNNNMSNPPRRKMLEETTSDGELIETIKTFNPALYRALKDPLERFLIVYSRYVDLGAVRKSANLRHNVLNEHIQRYHERIAFNMPAGTLPFKHANNNNTTMQSDRGGASKGNDHKNPSKTSSYFEKEKIIANPKQQKGKGNGQFRSDSSEAKSLGAVDSSRLNSVDSSDLQDDEELKNVDENESPVGSPRQSSTGTKKKEGVKKKNGLVPNWVQAYHRLEQHPTISLWDLVQGVKEQSAESGRVKKKVKSLIKTRETQEQNSHPIPKKIPDSSRKSCPSINRKDERSPTKKVKRNLQKSKSNQRNDSITILYAPPQIKMSTSADPSRTPSSPISPPRISRLRNVGPVHSCFISPVSSTCVQRKGTHLTVSSKNSSNNSLRPTRTMSNAVRSQSTKSISLKTSQSINLGKSSTGSQNSVQAVRMVLPELSVVVKPSISLKSGAIKMKSKSKKEGKKKLKSSQKSLLTSMTNITTELGKFQGRRNGRKKIK